MKDGSFDAAEKQIPGYDHVYRLDLGSTVAFLVIHKLIGGRAFGGIRIREYRDEEAALDEAQGLAEAMTRKTVICGIHGGGAKTVMLEPDPGVREDAVRRLGRFIQSLGGAYYCGGDFGFTSHDLAAIRAQTSYVACGNLADHSARSVVDCLQAVIPEDGVPWKTAIVQGLGAIGLGVARRLSEAGVQVMGTDLMPTRNSGVMNPQDALTTPCDAFVPCAIGGVIDENVASTIPCRIICGGANNPLTDDSVAERLHQRGVIYVPDFVANAGATAYGASDAIGERDAIESRLQALPNLAREFVNQSRVENRSPLALALEYVNRRLEHPR